MNPESGAHALVCNVCGTDAPNLEAAFVGLDLVQKMPTPTPTPTTALTPTSTTCAAKVLTPTQLKIYM